MVDTSGSCPGKGGSNPLFSNFLIKMINSIGRVSRLQRGS